MFWVFGCYGYQKIDFDDDLYDSEVDSHLGINSKRGDDPEVTLASAIMLAQILGGLVRLQSLRVPLSLILVMSLLRLRLDQ